MTTITVQSPRTVLSPRGAAFAARAFQSLATAFSGLAAARAQRAERRMALSRIGDATSVRRYAMAMMAHDPRFAADLFAAADRHEQLGE